jgi:hypothetical protein
MPARPPGRGCGEGDLGARSGYEVGEIVSEACEEESLLHGRVMLAGEFHRTDDGAIARAMAGIEGPCVGLTLAVVVRPPGMLGYFAPCSGLILLEEIHRDLEAEAQRRACRLTHLAPSGLCVDYLVAKCWGDLARHTEARSYDTILVPERPTRLRDRRLLCRMGWTTTSRTGLAHAAMSWLAARPDGARAWPNAR